MIKIVTIIGARPQIIKAAALSRAINQKFSGQIEEIIVHTGQHYDENMSQVFFDELSIPAPDYNLNVGSGSHGKQTAAMITGIEEILEKEKPACIVLYGDTNSTLAGGIAASKIHVPVAHIEAGLRSFNKKMPEEVNRILCDHVSTLLFSPTSVGYQNLLREGFDEKNMKGKASSDHPHFYHCGDIMYDNSLHFAAISDQQTNIMERLQLQKNKFILSTIHRNNNTDEPERLQSIFSALDKISRQDKLKVVLPLHPRTAKLLDKNLDEVLLKSVRSNPDFCITEPASFLEMIALEKNATLVMTDSGGVQKEAFFFKKPCVILRPQTEWLELVSCGAAILADADEQKILNAYNHFKNKTDLQFPSVFGDGKAAEFICGELVKTFA